MHPLLSISIPFFQISILTQATSCDCKDCLSWQTYPLTTPGLEMDEWWWMDHLASWVARDSAIHGSHLIMIQTPGPTIGWSWGPTILPQWLGHWCAIFRNIDHNFRTFPPISQLLSTFPRISTKFSIFSSIWGNYNDLTAISLEWWLGFGNYPNISQHFRLVNYYTLLSNINNIPNHFPCHVYRSKF